MHGALADGPDSWVAEVSSLSFWKERGDGGGGGAGLTLLLIACAQGSCAWAEGLGGCVCVCLSVDNLSLSALPVDLGFVPTRV